MSSATVGTISTHRPEVVAERLAKTAGLEKITLHVDDDQRGFGGIEGESERLGGDFDHPQCPAMCRPIVLRSAFAASVR